MQVSKLRLLDDVLPNYHHRHLKECPQNVALTVSMCCTEAHTMHGNCYNFMLRKQAASG